MPRQPRFSKDDIVAAGLRIVRAGGFEAISARALGKELGTSSSPLRLVAFAKEDSNVFQMLFLGKNARTEIAESIARECLSAVEQGYSLTTEQAELLFRQMWPVACGIAALCVKHPEDFPQEEVSKTLSYHFSGIMSIIKSGKEVEDSFFDGSGRFCLREEIRVNLRSALVRKFNTFIYYTGIRFKRLQAVFNNTCFRTYVINI